MKKIATIIAFFAFSSCATTQNFSAANDILALMDALKSNNYALAQNYIDKTALKTQAYGIIRNAMIDKGSEKIGDSLLGKSAVIAGVDLLKPVIEALSDEAFEAKNLAYFTNKAGLNQNFATPSKFKAALALDSVADGRVCIPDPATKQCLLYFGRYENTWKLNGFNEVALYNKYETRIKQATQNLTLKF